MKKSLKDASLASLGLVFPTLVTAENLSSSPLARDTNDDTEWGQVGDSAPPQGITENFTLQCIHVVMLCKYLL